ncbi:ATP-binding cassette domain-containing protein [Halostagnicola bangensis]
MTILETENLTKSFGKLVAVDGVTLAVEEGTVHSVIGPNGAGKSTLFNLITGLYEPTNGRMTFDGADITGQDPDEIVRLGIARSFQTSDVFPAMTVKENVLTAAQAASDHKRSIRVKANSLEEHTQRAESVLADIGLEQYTDTVARNLSHGDRRKLEIALTIVNNPTVLLLDEPAAGMGKEESLELTEMIERITTERGITVMLIEHDIEIVMDISDRITVLQAGQIIADGTPEEVGADETVRKAYLGTGDKKWRGSVASSKSADDTSEEPEQDGDPLLRVNSLFAGYGQGDIIRNVSLSVEEGEIVSLIGRNGVGKTTTLRSIAGALESRGTVTLGSTDVSKYSDHQRATQGIGFVPEDRQIFPYLTVEENLQMGTLGSAEDGVYTLEEIFEQFPRLRERRHNLGVQLSGGEQQMLAIARVLLSPTDVLLLDEPTEGLAPQIVSDVLEIITDIREEGISVLLVEQNLNVVLKAADRHYVLHNGEIVFQGSRTELQEHNEVVDEYLGIAAGSSTDTL